VNVQAALCATLVDEWVRAGLTDAVVCPGSRSTPIALALADAEAAGHVRVHVFLDERAGGFAALGMALASGRPALVVTTSGTAAVELHPAVVEAAAAGVGIVACTADRPAELQGVGAPQTIDQHRLFGRSAWFADAHAGLPPASWRSVAARVWVEAAAGRPVQLNLAFREPLVAGEAERARASASVPPGRTDGSPWHRGVAGLRPAPPPAAVEAAVSLLAGARRGLVVAGRGAGDPDAVAALGRRGWVVLADPLSASRGPGAVGAFDPLLRSPFASSHHPDAVLRLGAPPASRVLAEWLAGLDVPQVAAAPHGWPDPERNASLVIGGDPAVVARALAGAGGDCDPAWPEAWRRAEAAAQGAIDAVLAGRAEPTEPFVARSLVDALPAGSVLVASSSMPIREVEWFARPRPGLRVVSNRGANGIDGVVSTALGAALARGRGRPVAALLGDLALLHDAGALLWAPARECDLVLVVVDNGGGGIFEFLPQAGALPRADFERLFATPHGLDLAALLAAYGVPATVVDTAAGFGPALRQALDEGGVRAVLVRADRAVTVAVHEEINRAVAAAVSTKGPAAGG
jgi:2-succinyl-5-enolpyruvyl-6-hydroxy-3-cyclohexene-1-carboxylate synthase